MSVKRFFLYTLCAVLLPFPAFAGDMEIYAASLLYAFFYLIIPFIIIEAFLIYQKLNTENINKKRAMLISISANWYSVIMGGISILLLLLLVQFAVLKPLADNFCRADSFCGNRGFLYNVILSPAVGFESEFYDYGMIYYILIYALMAYWVEYAVFQKEIENVNQKVLRSLAVVSTVIKYGFILIWFLFLISNKS